MGFNTKLIFALSIFTHNCCNSSNYKDYDLESDKVCSKELIVGQGNRSSIIVKHAGELDKWDGKKDFECTFYVKASFEMGLFAVIQQMNLRKDKDCIDFIKFRHGKKKFPIPLPSWNKPDKKDSQWSSPICGKVERLQEPVTVGQPEIASVSKETHLAPHAFLDPEGEIEIKLHISRHKVPEFSLKNLLLVVAFTSYRDCKIPSGGYKSCGQDTCIYKDYFEDKIVNCPYVDCKDESECPDFVFDDEEGNNFLSTKVTITAVSSIFLSFFIFLGCIMLCRYMEIMCWSGNPSGDRGTELSQVEPTAPPLPSPDKDLPPAYETLFPQNN
ncbi:hypothetical protein O3M35_010755 [Rhynocoris fuscipes]|uniref:Uncharacterized protein n=1 Tax=Rhynocoris fuscipes TaxID=488301 RepID=A0AAW1D7U6_9HEMI